MTEEEMTVKDDLVVSLQYQVNLESGQEIERTESDAPLEYLHGSSQIIPGLEQAIEGMSIGEEKEVHLEPAAAYGQRNPDEIVDVDKDSFPESMDLSIGSAVAVRDEESGQSFQAIIQEVDDDKVVLDFNHPLAGESLHFKVKVVGLRPGTDAEIDHGHVHDEDGHSHD